MQNNEFPTGFPNNTPFYSKCVVCLVAKPLYRSETTGDLVVIQTMLLFICKSFCYHVN